MKSISILICLLFLWTSFCLAQQPAHFIYFQRDRADIHTDSLFLNTAQAKGAQIMYTWKQLEPQKDKYDFSLIEEDLAFLHRKGKKLFVQLQDVSFDTSIINVPTYLQREVQYHRGVAFQYVYPDDDPKKPMQKLGWVARRWDSAVRQRFHKLIAALGKRFDGRLAGINFPETAIDMSDYGPFPQGFTFENYCQGIIATMKAAKTAFPTTTVIQYANFMPGDARSDHGKAYLNQVYAAASRLNVGVGGPDVLVNRPYQMQNSYRLLHQLNPASTIGMAVQWNNYKAVDPEKGTQVSVEDIYRFANDYLHADYLFWCRQPPYYRQRVIPFLKKEALK